MALHDHCATARLAFLISDALRPVVHGLGLSTPDARYDNFAHKTLCSRPNIRLHSRSADRL